jgi:hypothetical protein
MITKDLQQKRKPFRGSWSLHFPSELVSFQLSNMRRPDLTKARFQPVVSGGLSPRNSNKARN